MEKFLVKLRRHGSKHPFPKRVGISKLRMVNKQGNKLGRHNQSMPILYSHAETEPLCTAVAHRDSHEIYRRQCDAPAIVAGFSYSRSYSFGKPKAFGGTLLFKI